MSLLCCRWLLKYLTKYLYIHSFFFSLSHKCTFFLCSLSCQHTWAARMLFPNWQIEKKAQLLAQKWNSVNKTICRCPLIVLFAGCVLILAAPHWLVTLSPSQITNFGSVWSQITLKCGFKKGVYEMDPKQSISSLKAKQTAVQSSVGYCTRIEWIIG